MLKSQFDFIMERLGQLEGRMDSIDEKMDVLIFGRVLESRFQSVQDSVHSEQQREQECEQPVGTLSDEQREGFVISFVCEGKGGQTGSG